MMTLEKKDVTIEELEQYRWISAEIDALNEQIYAMCIRYHYLLGYTWKETSKRVYGYKNGNYYNARKAVFRYFGKE